VQQRVSCDRCTAHRDLTLSPSCLVCGAVACSPVPLSPGDLDAAYSTLLRQALNLRILRPTSDVDAICDAIRASASQVRAA
jgi:rRNA maturation protein Nop10